MKNADSPATPIIDDCITTHEKEIYLGLTKREMFAMEAMKAIVSNSSLVDYFSVKLIEDVKEMSYELADKMLEE